MTFENEQRDSERVGEHIAVTLTYGVPKKRCEAICEDISKSGIGVIVDTVIPLNSECMLRVHDGRNRRSEYQAIIEIRRIFPLDDGMFKLGATIIEKLDKDIFKS